MDDPGEQEKVFNTGLVIVVSAVVTHPPGTTFDLDGNPIPAGDGAEWL